jgi:hypothetical protein
VAGINVGELEAVLRLRDEMSSQLQSSLKVLDKLDAALGQTDEALKHTEKQSEATGIAIGVVLGGWIEKASERIIEFGTEALQTAAKAETLVGVSRFMGQQVGYTSASIDALSHSLEKQGITTVQSRDTIIQLIRANLDLGKATDLAAVAQSAARATGENSSETLNRLIHGIQTLQPEVLRSSGIVVSADQEYQKWAATHGRVAQSMSGVEKQQALLSAVLREGEKIAGVYGVTNEFVGGKLQSLKRYQEEAGRSLGEMFLPALRIGVDLLTAFYKELAKSPEVFAATAGAIAVAGVALSVSWAVPVAAAVAATYLLMSAFTDTTDPVKNLSFALAFLSDFVQSLRIEWTNMVATAEGFEAKLADVFALVAKAQSNKEQQGYWEAYASSARLARDETEKTVKALETARDTHTSTAAATKNASAALDELQKHAAELAKQTAEAAAKEAAHAAALKAAAAAAKKHAEEIKNLTQQYTSMMEGLPSDKDTDKLTVLWGILSNHINELTDKDLLKLREEFKKLGTDGQAAAQQLTDVIQNSGRLFGRELPRTMSAGEYQIQKTTEEIAQAYVRQENEKYNETFKTNAEIAKQAAAELALGHISGVVYDKIISDLKVVPEHTEKATKASFDWQKAIQQVADTFQLLGFDANTTLGSIVSSIGLAITGFVAYDAARKKATAPGATEEDKEAFRWQQIQAGIAAAAAAVAIYQKNKENLNAGAAALSGAAQGAAAGAAFGLPGAIIGGVLGGLIGLFSGSKWRDMAKTAANVLGVAVTDEMAKAVDATMKQLNVSAPTAALLNLDKAMASSTRSAASFAPQVLALIAGVASGAVPAKQGVEQITKAWQAMSAEAGQGRVTKEMLAIMAAAKAAGVQVQTIRDFIKGLATDAIPVLESAWKSLDKHSVDLEKQMGNLAAATAGAFQALLESGASISEIFKQLGPVIDAAVKSYEELGLDVPDVLGNVVQLREFVQAHQDLANAMAGWGSVIKLAAAGFGDLGTAVLQVTEFMKQAEAAGLTHAQALFLNRDALREIDYLYQHGLLPDLDEGTKKLIDEAKAGGLLDPTPQDRMATATEHLVEVMALLAEHFGVTLPKSIQDYIDSLNNIPSDVSTNVHLHVPNDPGDPNSNYDPNTQPTASGWAGWVNRPTKRLFGEAGPEFVSITPAAEMRTSGPRGLSSTAGGGITINVDARGATDPAATSRAVLAGLQTTQAQGVIAEIARRQVRAR